MQRQTIDLGDPPELTHRPYSVAIAARGAFVFTSGHMGFDPRTGSAPPGIRAQTEQCLENLRTVLAAAGTSFAHAVKVNVYLADPDHFEEMNKVYRRYFATDRPARTTVNTLLMRADLLIEIIALLPYEESRQ